MSEREDYFLSLSNEELARIDPVVLNLTIAKGVPALADLDMDRYVRLADRWAEDIERRVPGCDESFGHSPEEWDNDLDFARLTIVWWYAEFVLGIAYREDQREDALRDAKCPPGMKKGIIYTDPTDLFLNGVMDTRQGTCANMAILFVALCWRLGWPVRLACLRSHYLARYDDGTKTYNIETSQIGSGIGFRSPPDQWYMEDEDLPKRAVDCGSDLRALTPRETLGVFFGLRARHRENTHRPMEAEPDYLVARYLFPNSRQLYINQNQVSV